MICYNSSYCISESYTTSNFANPNKFQLHLASISGIYILAISSFKHSGNTHGLMINPVDNKYAYLGMSLPISSANIGRTGYMLNEPVKYNSNAVISVMTTGNSNLDGTTGTYYDSITGSSSGTLVTRITIKAQGNTSRGMVRIFFKASSSVWLMREVEVPAITQAATAQTFIAVIADTFFLKASYLLRFSTQNSDTIIVTAEGLDTSYPF